MSLYGQGKRCGRCGSRWNVAGARPWVLVQLLVGRVRYCQDCAPFAAVTAAADHNGAVDA